ncbi:pre-rRNA-processing protein esf1 [Thoreauomyces humboldtii]|nr:pre-rRNA-processing protein esf1 [Thoreauomyces humboldtii]
MAKGNKKSTAPATKAPPPPPPPPAKSEKTTTTTKKSAARAPVSNVPITTDPRFSRVHSDPRFIKARKDAAKVTIDERFKGMLESDEFGTGASGPRVDKYGRAARKTGKGGLERFYKLDEVESGGDDDQEEDDVEEGVTIGDDQDESDSDEDDTAPLGSDEEPGSEFESGSIDGDEDETLPRVSRFDLARGGGDLESDSESEPEDGPDAADAAESGDASGFYAEEDIPTGDETSRFAVVNLDWDHVKAADLFKIFDGFKPATGAVRNVRIYPSEFGLERLEREAREGPPKELFEEPVSSEASSEEDDGQDLNGRLIQVDDGAPDNVKLRAYQLERLRYYYAVVETDSVDTARAIYAATDGTEFEASANFFDLRYIPDGMEFDHPPKDEATSLPSAYAPRDFVTSALQHSNVKLTWDEDDDDRVRVTRRKFTKADLEEMDFKAYLASSSSEDEEDPAAAREKFRALLGGAAASGAGDVYGGKGKGEELEITFAPGLSEKAAALLEKKKNDAAQKDETVFDTYLRTQKEKRKAKKTARKTGEALPTNDSDDHSHNASSDDDHHGVDMSDPFFADAFGPEFDGPANDSDDVAAPPKSKKDKKEKKPKKPSPSSKEALALAAREKAELELLLLSDPTTTTTGAVATTSGNTVVSDARHFDARQIIKEEKAAKRKKSRKATKKETREGGVQEGFEIDTTDPRFTDMMDNHNFAIDPTNPQFKKTQAMGKLLDERRKRRTEENVGDDGPAIAVKLGKTNEKQAAGEMSSLVDSVKRKSAMAMGGDGRGKRQKKAAGSKK